MKILIITLLGFLLVSCSKNETEINGEVFVVTQGAGNYKLGLVQVMAVPEDFIKPYLESKKSNEEQLAKAEWQRLKEKLVSDKNALLKEEQNKKDFEAAKKNYVDSLEKALDGNGSYDNAISAGNKLQNINDPQWLQSRLDDAENRVLKTQNDVNSALERLNQASGAERYFDNLITYPIQTQSNSDGIFNLKLPKIGKYVLIAKAERKVPDKTEKYYWMVWVNADGKSQKILLSNNNLTDSGSPDSAIKTTVYEP